MKEETKSLDKYFHYAKQGYDIDAIMKDLQIPSSMFDNVVEDWYDKQVHVGTARLATTSIENRNMMLLLC